MDEVCSYRTVKSKSESLFKDRGSKFYGYLFPLNINDDIKKHLAKIQSIHPKARHHCYAYRLGTKDLMERANDDGEPNGSAGLPILNQLKSYDITNTLAIVVRYFGGTKLGVSGLINAYKEATKIAINENSIIEKELTSLFEITTDYEHANHVFKLLDKFNGRIIHQLYHEKSIFKVEVPNQQKKVFLNAAAEIRILYVKNV